jgi:hypothetical protein
LLRASAICRTAMARYKSIAPIQAPLLAWLERRAAEG